MRGARASVALDGHAIPPHPGPEDMEEGPLASAVSAYSVAAPELLEATVRSFARAPLQVLARIDVAAGGTGIPAGESVRLQGLGRLIARPPPGLPGKRRLRIDKGAGIGGMGIDKVRGLVPVGGNLLIRPQRQQALRPCRGDDRDAQ